MTPLVIDRLAGAAAALAIALALVALRHVKKVDWRLLQWSVRTFFSGAVSGGVLLFTPDDRGEVSAALTGIALTAAILSLRGEEGDWADALLRGSLTGVGAGAVQLLVPDRAHDIEVLRLLLGGTLAGAGTHLARIARRRWLWLLLPLTALTAGAASALPHLPRMYRYDPRSLAMAWTALLAAVVVAVVFRRWPMVVAELTEEAALGFFDARDIASVAHPWRRLLHDGWRDEPARRRFVERANELALRKRAQRKMPPETARLHQLEILKLRMEVQEIASVRDAMARESSASA